MKNRIFKIVVISLFTIAAIVILMGKSSAKSEEVVTAPIIEDQQVKSLPRLLELGSHSCVPCKMMMPILDTLRNFYPQKLTIDFIDVWKDREAGEKYSVRAIPTQIIYDKNGEELFRHEGFWSRKEIETKFDELGISLTGELL